MKKYVAILLLAGFSVLLVSGQEKEPAILQTDTLTVLKRTDIVGIPVLFYTPETSFGFGTGVQFVFNNLINVFNSRLSDMMVTAVYTTKKQFLLDARPQIHIYDGQFYIDGVFQYRIFPNLFWGIGNHTVEKEQEEYSMETIKFEATILNRIPPSLNFGFEYNFEHHIIVNKEQEGAIKNGNIPGASGARISSLSMVYNFDNRDNVYSPFCGNYFQMKAGFSSWVLGGTFSYNKYILDLRKYFPVTRNSVLACQHYMELTFGDAPFQAKPWLGGGERNRGYYKGRYIDDQYYTIQTEFRWRFLPRWIMVAFACGGEVADLPGNLYDDIKTSFGGGVRYKISKKSPALVRFDYGYGGDGNYGFYFGINEAF